MVWWSRGGPTTVDDLALLCHRRHTLIHAQPERDEHAWVMVVRDGVPWFRPPDRLDLDRRLRRNTFHQAVEATRRTGLRWRTPPADLVDRAGCDPDPP